MVRSRRNKRYTTAMNIPYDYIVHNIGSEKEPAYKAFVPALDATVYGANTGELEEGIAETISLEIKRRKKRGVAMPAPERQAQHSGKLVLRIPPPIHERLALEAKVKGKSLNTYLLEKVAA